MADQQQGAVELEQALLEQVQGLHVEIVGRLVEHQQIAGTREQSRQQQPVALAAGQGAHRLARALRLEQEVPEPGHQVAGAPADLDPVAPLGDVVEHAGVGVQGCPLLVEVGDLQPRAAAQPARIGLQLPQQQADQAGLADPVGADDAHPVAAQDPGVQPPDERAVAQGQGYVLGLEHQSSAAFGLFQPDAGLARSGAPGATFLAQPFQGADPALVAGATGLDALPDPGLFLGQPAVLAGVLGGLRGQRRLAPLQKAVVVAGPAAQPAAVELDDARGQPAQEGAVVGDEQQRTAELDQKLLQPADGLDVEVVGGLVEQQQVGLGDQRPRQQHPALEAAGQLRELGIRVQPQARQHRLDAVGVAPAASRLEPVLDARQPFQRRLRAVLGDPPAGRVPVAQVGGQPAQGVRDPVVDPALQVLGYRLLQPGDAQPVGNPALTAVRGQFAGDDAQQRALAGAVAAHQADPFALLQPQVGPLEQRGAAEGKRDIAQGEETHGRFGSLAVVGA